MNDKLKLIVILLVLGLLIACAYIAYQLLADGNAPDSLAGQDSTASYTAPDFKVVSLSGQEVSLSDYLGKPVVINFWASWCPPCKQELPDFDSVYAEYRDRVEFMMVNVTDGMQETEKSARDYLSGQSFGFPVYLDLYLQGSYAYRVSSLPATYFVDADGELVTYAVGMIDAATIKKGIGMILK